MNFENALTALKNGSKICRAGWNGKGMFLYMVPAGTYPAQTEIAKLEFGGEVPYEPYIAIKTVQGMVSAGWRPTSMDMFADDWQILD